MIPPALDQLQQGVEQYLNLGVVPVGVSALHARVASVNVGANPAQAVVASCPSSPRLVNRKTNKPVPFKALPANPVTVDLQTVQGHWVVSFLQGGSEQNVLLVARRRVALSACVPRGFSASW